MDLIKKPIFGTLAVMFITGFALLLSLKVCGIIPVSEGAGWDGSLYIQYAFAIAKGVEIPNDPYRLTRMLAFLPATIGFYFGLERRGALLTQVFNNIFVLSMAAGLLYSSLRKINVDVQRALLTSFTFVLTWPVLVMSVFYPMLSDHIAIFVACFSIWLWVQNTKYLLLPLIVASFWIMPGLAIAPFTFFLFNSPRYIATFSSKSDESKKQIFNERVKFAFSMFLSISMLGLYLLQVSKIEGSQIYRHAIGMGGGTSIPSVKWLSASFVVMGLLFISVIWAKFLLNSYLYKSLRSNRVGVGILALGVGALSIKLLLKWDTGFRGPPLGLNLILQSLTAPAKPIVSHLLYFGPAALISVYFTYCLVIKEKISSYNVPFIFLISFLLPILLLGSESRQWIVIFPILIFFYGTLKLPYKMHYVVILMNGLICIPVFWLNANVASALLKTENLTSFGWQFYFGYQGPWMSNFVYLIGLSALILLSGFFAFYVRKNLGKMNLDSEREIVRTEPILPS